MGKSISSSRIIALVAVLILGGVGYWVYVQKQDTVLHRSQKGSCDSTRDTYEKSYEKSKCVIDLARESRKLETCNEIVDNLSGIETRDAVRNLVRCYGAVGVETKDLNICRTLSEFPGDSGTSGDYIKAQCIAGIATALGDANICDQIPERSMTEYVSARDSCYMDVAEATNSPTLCEEISTWPDNYGLNHFCSTYRKTLP